METPKVSLSPSERLTLHALAQGNENEIAFDWLALQRLKSFGFVEETQHGPKITTAGKRATGRADPQTYRAPVKTSITWTPAQGAACHPPHAMGDFRTASMLHGPGPDAVM